ncbi:NADP-dependent 3-hydroxy acid dehydrogenase YdfG [Leifsonia sp. 98AMF]|uniref:SDR family NAD(P)-dependent oxidoreductase n=1 Tax=unclassified Leifsonia TaxID=2663824 RepID=UPI00087960B6|nr:MULTISPECIES: SDR family NAD(P)-dependent oxidoreductase [unclassified Leifsonia]SDH09516.1 NADP-dependent 3-hydroxy acid dehydrogenase YdfG [Leifsonia sp. 197AMF]SDJ29806.1 NADP-dependent 3-hydroxy acid dehydrogenase YdfG [Leifsonia sp. 466MF]SDK50660.1 NADP-dependent 3-hydroxy acid dehydrogenase YdfG [Leifsonia sp. 157MF]SDN51564.1 NADP-dependent 3-hydroxy acid dehydrogenase YdfG [Leifsonia sp. 509MF]SEN58633.1 NADP-dependent 3-hydroxy acid dehydrogenase YdfG [Leifsonia sp. 467MF]
MTTTLITGANRSLGLETARRLIEAGHTVYAGMRDIAAGDEARALGAIPLALDVTDQASVDAAVASLPELDVLVNNAGVLGGRRQGADDLDIEAMRQTLDTNVVGVARVTQACLPLLRRSAAPVIVNVASGVGWPRWLSTPGHDEHPVLGIAYAASKAAVIALTVQYAKGLPGFRVNASDPGYTATEFNGYSGHQTVQEGTDATVALATLGPDGPTGEFHNRFGRIEY